MHFLVQNNFCEAFFFGGGGGFMISHHTSTLHNFNFVANLSIKIFKKNLHAATYKKREIFAKINFTFYFTSTSIIGPNGYKKIFISVAIRKTAVLHIMSLRYYRREESSV